ncbi:hypothetical protein PGTUg99_022038 [Puccinia graminis f. sp. tritici]|uniref:Uncharacterized protein n=1 Tax=Puccinia graminis f. sp. tritici TaxID=56615 RepID=A0A5B0R4Y9_PUCGR|nr:hypothetical protein PGTUg99_022038 [Puccinia graminis f. sp. tritici]
MSTTTQQPWQSQASVAYTTVIWLSHRCDATAVVLRTTLSASEKEYIRLARDVRGISVATNSHPSLSLIVLHHQHPRQYVSVVMKKNQSLKINCPIKKNGPDDDLGSFWPLPLRYQPSELDDNPI